jgi:hypothetical protein
MDIINKKMRLTFTNNKTEECISTYFFVKINSNQYALSFSSKKHNIGALLLNLLETDFNTFESFKLFIEKWGVSALADISDTARSLLESNKTLSSSQYGAFIKNVYSEASDYLMEGKHVFDKAIHYCISLNGPEWSTGLITSKRFYLMPKFLGSDMILLNSYNKIDSSIGIASENIDFDENFLFGGLTGIEAVEYVKALNDDDFQMGKLLQSGSICNIAYAELYEMILNNIPVKKCGNCNKYFVLTNRIDTQFCDRVVKTLDNGTQKTCKDVGAVRRYANKSDKDPAMLIYRKAYKTMHARMVSRRITSDILNEWIKGAKEKFLLVKEGKIALNEFEEWINAFRA